MTEAEAEILVDDLVRKVGRGMRSGAEADKGAAFDARNDLVRRLASPPREALREALWPLRVSETEPLDNIARRLVREVANLTRERDEWIARHSAALRSPQQCACGCQRELVDGDGPGGRAHPCWLCVCGHRLDEHDGGGPDDPHRPTCEVSGCRCEGWSRQDVTAQARVEALAKDLDADKGPWNGPSVARALRAALAFPPAPSPSSAPDPERGLRERVEALAANAEEHARSFKAAAEEMESRGYYGTSLHGAWASAEQHAKDLRRALASAPGAAPEGDDRG